MNGIDPRSVAEVLGALDVSPETAEAAVEMLRTGRRGVSVGAFWPTVEEFLTGAQSRSYLPPLKDFVIEFAEKDLLDITPDDIERFCRARDAGGRSRGYSGVYQFEHALRGVRWLFKRAIKARIVSRNPGLEVELPDRDDANRRAFTEKELRELWRLAFITSDDPELDMLILWFLRETACRRNALIEVRADQMRSTSLGHSICLVEKNNRRPQIPISGALLVALYKHAADRGVPASAQHEQLFRYKDGSPLTDRRFDNLFPRLRDYEVFRGLKPTAHWLRYTTLEDVEILTSQRVAKSYAGHRPNKTIERYTWAQMRELHDVHTRLFGEAGPSVDRLLRRAA